MFSISRFAEVLKHLPRSVFDRAVTEVQADRYRKSFNAWQQLVSMTYAQFSGVTSLRTLEQSFNAQSAHHYHLGCGRIRRSTLADMNAKGSVSAFAKLAEALMQQAPRALRQEGLPLVRLLDSSSLTLQGRGFDEWTKHHRTRNTQGLKLHLLFGLNEQAPLAHAFSAANVNDIEYARSVHIERGALYVFDRAFCDFSWWWRLHVNGARFVTRFKRNTKLEVIDSRKIAPQARGIILKDEVILLANTHPAAGRHNPYQTPLRRVTVARDHDRPLILATNDLKAPALQIAEHYRSRWQIELYFKWIKQHLRIKRFLGKSEAAVKIQILTALIAYLLLALYAKAHGIKQTLWLLLNELRSTLFMRSNSERLRHARWRLNRSLFLDKQTQLPL